MDIEPAGTVREYDHWIDGVALPGATGGRVDVLCPSDGRLIARLARGNGVDVDKAVAAARRALETGPWSRWSAAERGRLLMRVSHAAAERQDELAALESLDTGKPLSQGRADAAALVRYLEYYAGAADKLHGDTIPFLDGYQAISQREPLGVVGIIIPWNYPAQMVGRTVCAALAMGNTVVVKPAEDACLTPLEIARLFSTCGLPDGVLNVVTGLGEEAGAALAVHAGIDHVSFTGSPQVGSIVQAAAGQNHVGCTLELGGKSPQIVFDDADLDAAIPVICKAIVQNAGQTCSAGSRLLVHEKVHDELIARLRPRFAELRCGPHDSDLDCGALINDRQQARVQGFLDRATADGIQVLARGRLADDAPEGGYYFPPVMLGPVPEDHELAREEVFGPALSVMTFRDEEDAIRLANATDYGLVAGIWTRDGGRQFRMAKRVRVGQVFVNGYGAGGGIELPFGGVKRSGHGREKGFVGLLEFSQLKTIVFNHG